MVDMTSKNSSSCTVSYTPLLMKTNFISFVVLTSLLYIRIIYHCYGLNSQAHERLRVETSP